jgi:hypothetical protein
MGKRKWGESFLKSGLPLEHLTLLSFRSLNYLCSPNVEYPRLDETGNKKWFEIDLLAESVSKNKDTSVSFLVECKYHDSSRFWFFLPHESYRWYFDDRFFNCGPYQTLSKPTAKTALTLAPLSYGGIVVSQDGLKQDNSVYTAIQQLANAFVPYTLSYVFDFLIKALPARTIATIPLIVTNAKIFRLKPSITSIETIREARSESEIADEIKWTWCFHDPSRDLIDMNSGIIESFKKQKAKALSHFPIINRRLELWDSRPNWIAITNLKSLSSAIKKIEKHFLSIQTCKISTARKDDRKVRVE